MYFYYLLLLFQVGSGSTGSLTAGWFRRKRKVLTWRPDMAETRHTIYEELKGGTREVMNQIRSLIKKCNARSIIIINRHVRFLFQTQLTIEVACTAVLVAVSTVLSAIGVILLLTYHTWVVVVRFVHC